MNNQVGKETTDKMNRETFERVMEHVIDSIEQAGYNARDQIKAYVLTADESYITREGKARDEIQCSALIYCRFYATIHPRRRFYDDNKDLSFKR